MQEDEDRCRATLAKEYDAGTTDGLAKDDYIKRIYGYTQDSQNILIGMWYVS